MRVSFIRFLFIIFIANGLISCQSILHPPKRTFEQNIVKQPFDAIIVPGFPYQGDEWAKLMEIRVQWAKLLVDSGYAKHIIFTGGAVYTPYVESKVMANYAIAMGVPEDIIFLESEAEHSTENVYYSYRIAKDKGFKNIALATDPYQLKKLRKFINKYELPVSYLPIVFEKLIISEPMNPKNVDCEDAKVNDFVSIKERESFFTRFRGTLGNNIKWHEEDVKSEKRKRKLAKEGKLIRSDS